MTAGHPLFTLLAVARIFWLSPVTVLRLTASTGRFPQVSNIRFQFDPTKPPGSRILSTQVGGKPLDLERIYVLATRGYMARGKDGYNSLLVEPEGGTCEEVVSEENGMLISAILRQYFMSLRVMDQWKRWTPSLSRHWDRVVSDVGGCHPARSSPVEAKTPTDKKEWPRPGLERKDSWAEWTPAKLRQRRSGFGPLTEDGEDSSDEDSGDEVKEQQDLDRELHVMRVVFHKWCRLAGVKGEACDSLQEDEIDCAWTKPIAPKVEGRIQIVGASY